MSVQLLNPDEHLYEHLCQHPASELYGNRHTSSTATRITQLKKLKGKSILMMMYVHVAHVASSLFVSYILCMV